MKLKQLVAELEKNPEFRAAYEELEPEHEIARQIMRIRLETGMTQKELAAKAGTRQAVISRLENAVSHPSLSLLKRVADAVGAKLKIEFDHPALQQEQAPSQVVVKTQVVYALQGPSFRAADRERPSTAWPKSSQYSGVFSIQGAGASRSFRQGSRPTHTGEA